MSSLIITCGAQPASMCNALLLLLLSTAGLLSGKHLARQTRTRHSALPASASAPPRSCARARVGASSWVRSAEVPTAHGSCREALWLRVCEGAAPLGVWVGQRGSHGWLQVVLMYAMCVSVYDAMSHSNTGHGTLCDVGGSLVYVQELSAHHRVMAHRLWRTGRYGLRALRCRTAVGRGEALAVDTGGKRDGTVVHCFGTAMQAMLSQL